MSKSFAVSILIVVFLSGGVFYLSLQNRNTDSIPGVSENNVSIVDGKQIIELKAKGGYSPEHSLAKAGIPTILRINTSGTFDCSSIVRIPKLGISKNLILSGSTDIDLGVQEAIVLAGTCGMGMYPFDIEFKN